MNAITVALTVLFVAAYLFLIYICFSKKTIDLPLKIWWWVTIIYSLGAFVTLLFFLPSVSLSWLPSSLLWVISMVLVIPAVIFYYAISLSGLPVPLVAMPTLGDSNYTPPALYIACIVGMVLALISVWALIKVRFNPRWAFVFIFISLMSFAISIWNYSSIICDSFICRRDESLFSLLINLCVSLMLLASAILIYRRAKDPLVSQK